MDVELVAMRYDDPVVVELVAEVQQEYVRRYGGPDDAVIDPEEFAEPAGLLLVAMVDGVPAAMGGWRHHAGAEHSGEADETVAEIKRMYVRPAMQRRGLARIVLAELERTAAAAGHRRLILNTGTEQPEAVQLYTSSNYQLTHGYGIYKEAGNAIFFSKDLPTTK